MRKNSCSGSLRAMVYKMKRSVYRSLTVNAQRGYRKQSYHVIRNQIFVFEQMDVKLKYKHSYTLDFETKLED
eukprot:snap_masked-scaffold_15-processed-gene-0.14-mRNA-1 protein AED:1.00 eAED:1.00 QI:0/0/0/0/1/1/2/0/71